MQSRLTCIVALLSLTACHSSSAPQGTNQVLEANIAKRYIAAWAREVRADANKVEESGGDFFGRVGSLGFEYLAGRKVLVVRGYVFPYSASFNAKPDLLPWLNQIAKDEPEPVRGGSFESLTPRWEPGKEPSLLLRIEVKDPALTDKQFVSQMLAFRDTALMWDRTKLTKALDGLVRHRRQLKQQNPNQP